MQHGQYNSLTTAAQGRYVTNCATWEKERCKVRSPHADQTFWCFLLQVLYEALHLKPQALVRKKHENSFLTLFTVLKWLEQSSPECSCPGEAIFATAMYHLSWCMQLIQRSSCGKLALVPVFQRVLPYGTRIGVKRCSTAIQKVEGAYPVKLH